MGSYDDDESTVVMSVEGLEEFEAPGGAKRWAYAPFRRRMRQAAAAADVVISTDRALQPVGAVHGIVNQQIVPDEITHISVIGAEYDHLGFHLAERVHLGQFSGFRV